MNDLIDILYPMATPLAIIFLGLLLLRRADAVVQPIVINVVNGLAKQAGSNSLFFGLMIGYGLSAGLQSLAEQATILKWLVIAALAKVLNPIIVAMLAFCAKNGLADTTTKPTGTGSTVAPFTPTTTTPPTQ